jgi:hypothetical protein
MIKKTKRGQMEISFQLIFSLILIAAFIYAAFVGIRYFMASADLAKINNFIVDLKGDVENAYMTTEVSKSYDYSLPSRIKWVCFSAQNTLTAGLLNSAPSECSQFETYLSSFKNMNMFFCPPEGAWKVKAPIYASIDCRGKECLDFVKNPYCIRNTEGKVTISLEKNFGDPKIKLK